MIIDNLIFAEILINYRFAWKQNVDMQFTLILGAAPCMQN